MERERERVEYFYKWFNKSSKTSKDTWTWEEGNKNTSKWSGTRGSSKRHQSLPINPADRPDPAEKGLPWNDIGDLDTSYDFLYPDNDVEKCPVEKADQLSTEQQLVHMQWIENILKMDRKSSKDPRLYCGCCDVNNHPRFTCKHAHKHQKPHEKHRCTLRAGRHPPFLCPRAQINCGEAQPNWYKLEYKRAKQENRESDYRWGHDAVALTLQRIWAIWFGRVFLGGGMVFAWDDCFRGSMSDL